MNTAIGFALMVLGLFVFVLALACGASLQGNCTFDSRTEKIFFHILPFVLMAICCGLMFCGNSFIKP